MFVPAFAVLLAIPTFATKCPSYLGKGATISSFARRFQEAEASFDTTAEQRPRAAALAQMIDAVERARQGRFVSRPFVARVSDAKKKLFEALTQPERASRWALAYTFAALDGEKLPAPQSPTPTGFAALRSPETEAAVKLCLERYLVRRGISFLTYVEVEPTSSKSMVRVRFRVTNVISLGLADGDPRVTLPDWVGTTPELRVHGFDHEFARVIDRGDRRATHRGILNSTLTATVKHTARPIFVEVTLDDRLIDRTLVSTAGSLLRHHRPTGADARFILTTSMGQDD